MHDLELTVVIFMLKKWRHYLLGDSIDLHRSQKLELDSNPEGIEHEAGTVARADGRL